MIRISHIIATGLVAGATAVLMAPSHAVAGRAELPGPVPARVLRVIDGDTIVVRARVWIDQQIEIQVRLGGIDTPELRGRCDFETTLARRARALVAAKVGDRDIKLRRIRYGKFAGRVVARVELASGEDLAAVLMAAGLGRPYNGAGRKPWCP
ncbi:MAG: nuclease [Alphaproteobacteria bacterium]